MNGGHKGGRFDFMMSEPRLLDMHVQVGFLLIVVNNFHEDGKPESRHEFSFTIDFFSYSNSVSNLLPRPPV